MNQIFNTCNQADDIMNGGGKMIYDASKQKFVPSAPDSLFSMALLEFESQTSAGQQQVASQQHQPTFRSRPSGQFYPVEGSDDARDLSLREILDITDDFLYEDDTDAVAAPAPMPTASCSFLPPVVTPNNSANNMMPMMSPVFNSSIMTMSPAPASTSANAEFPSCFPETSTNQAPSCLSKKRSCSDLQGDDSEDDEGSGPRFRPYQSGQWYDKFAELCEYKKRNGDCLVPHTCSQNLSLARWVKRQRYQYKLMKDGKVSTMTAERAQALENIGFCWDSQAAAWNERFNELVSFGQEFGHFNVPSNFSGNPQLATWVKCQRRQYKLFKEGKPSNMTVQRIEQLERLGFEWGLRVQKKSRRM